MNTRARSPWAAPAPWPTAIDADESRYLSDPAHATADEQGFLDRTQAVARLDGAP
ncbi:hypothetical protein GCM10010495_78220 [Kitasatospora herbaricolor]|uniref:hypothetical protein n=1 Tax=Kitasatospora herbaricolor TaxID=68217 RepID=UPI00174853B0|nr:hypothetical protein [Kitasatospora herbaricolor]MDQ0306672.1 hypothetical protein [Kitasatospora herbaricolor]GGV48728.1 hypothetical protein GCM10010495_78220 [Kitasatospora herbaricolor]